MYVQPNYLLNPCKYPMNWVLESENRNTCVRVINWIFCILALLISGYWCLIFLFFGGAILIALSTDTVDADQVSAWILLVFWPQFIYCIYNIVYLVRATSRKLENDDRNMNNLKFALFTFYTFVWIIPYAYYANKVDPNNCS